MTGRAHKKFHAAKLNRIINGHYCVLLHVLDDKSGIRTDLQEALGAEKLPDFINRVEFALKCSETDIRLAARIKHVQQELSAILFKKGINTNDLPRPTEELIHYFVRGDENIADYGNAAQLVFYALSYMEMTV